MEDIYLHVYLTQRKILKKDKRREEWQGVAWQPRFFFSSENFQEEEKFGERGNKSSAFMDIEKKGEKSVECLEEMSFNNVSLRIVQHLLSAVVP